MPTLTTTRHEWPKIIEDANPWQASLYRQLPQSRSAHRLLVSLHKERRRVVLCGDVAFWLAWDHEAGRWTFRSMARSEAINQNQPFTQKDV